MPDILPSVHLAFLGLGLIGGSVARAALTAGFASQAVAWTPGGRGPRAATADGIAAAATPEEAIRGADLVVLAGPPLACLELVDLIGGRLRAALAADAVVTDVASTKAVIVERARAAGIRFVGGHPLAGRETSGYGAADPDLLVDRPWVVVPAEPVDAAAEDRVAALATACGARPVRMSAVTHDAAVAAISHLPLVVSAAVVEAMAAEPDWPVARELAAGGWGSMTRLARGDAAMGAGILATNGPAVAARLRALRAVLDDWLTALSDGAADPEILRQRLEAARRLAGAPVDPLQPVDPKPPR